MMFWIVPFVLGVGCLTASVILLSSEFMLLALLFAVISLLITILNIQEN